MHFLSPMLYNLIQIVQIVQLIYTLKINLKIDYPTLIWDEVTFFWDVTEWLELDNFSVKFDFHE